jgi:hypothetical protein
VLYRLLADLTVVVHLGFIGFVAAGGLLASRPKGILVSRPQTMLIAHMSAVSWALGIVAVGWPCPLTSLEKWLRQRAGEKVYDTGFVDQYLTGVLYPERYEQIAQGVMAAAIVASYLILVLRKRRVPSPS